MLVEVVPSLVKGWPLPGAWSVVDHSAGNTSSALRRGPSLRVGVQLPVIAMQARTSVLSDKTNEFSANQNMISPQDCFKTISSLTTELLKLLSQFG